MSGQLLTVDVSEAHSSRQHPLGAITRDQDGKEYVYCDFGAAHAATDFVLIGAGYVTAAMNTTNTAAARGQQVGVVSYAATATEYGWVQRTGSVSGNVGTDTAAGDAINSTATAGRLDDDGTAGAELIEGVYVTATAASNAATVMLNNPFVGATL